ncbi:MAG: hypothetical protein NWF00_02020 [Candidatus Bathyarchaeota archaeon]|nr:hypothetical protein [Candidatus Bathyarchaeota archaeon]
MQGITKQFKRFKREKRGVSAVITVMLSLILLIIVVSNVFLTSFQMNQVDLNRIQEDLNITSLTQAGVAAWSTAQNEFTVNTGTHVGS